MLEHSNTLTPLNVPVQVRFERDELLMGPTAVPCGLSSATEAVAWGPFASL